MKLSAKDEINVPITLSVFRDKHLKLSRVDGCNKLKFIDDFIVVIFF